MADAKVVRGTLGGVVVQTSEANAERLGPALEPEKAPASKSTSSKSSK